MGRFTPLIKKKLKYWEVIFSPYTLRRKPAALNWQQYCLRSERNSESLDTITFTPCDVHDELQRINVTKSSGPDQLPGRLLKEGAEWIAEPLSQLLNKSMAAGILPGDWTIANITPIHKKMTNTLLATIVPLVSQALL